MKTLQVILIALATLSGCKKSVAEYGNQAPTTTIGDTSSMKITGHYTYLALGDSYTIGQSVPQSQSYPYQLAASLTAYGYYVGDPTIIATTGWTTDNLIDAIAQSSITGNKFDFVTLLIGVNDQYQGLSQDNYKTKFTQVLNTAIKFAGGNVNRVFVISIPDWGVTPFGGGRDNIIGPQIDAFNAINREISAGAGVNYIDITPTSRQAATNLNLVASDGLHPSGMMYTLWVNAIAPQVVAQLKK